MVYTIPLNNPGRGGLGGFVAIGFGWQNGGLGFQHLFKQVEVVEGYPLVSGLLSF